MKICHVFPGAEGGRWVYEQLDALRSLGADPAAVLGADEGTLVDRCRIADIPVTSLPQSIAGWPNMVRYPFRVLRLAWWLRRERIEVVQSHIFFAMLFARPAAWLADVPVRLEMTTSPFYMQAPSLRWIERATAWMETALVPSCELSRRLFLDAGCPPGQVSRTLYYGPRAREFDPAEASPAGLRTEYGIPAGAPLIGSIALFYDRCADSSFVPPEARGRFIKGTTDLIEALPIVQRRFPEARLVLVGGGWGANAAATEAELRSFVAERNLSDRVIFTGWRASAAAVLAELDVSVQAAVNENLGGVVESLLMARPTVATRVGGMPEAVIDGETGVLVNPSDPGDLADGICQLLADPARAAALGAAGRTMMLSRFTLETTAPALHALYRRRRASARGAWRWYVTAYRLALAPFVFLPIVLRAVAYDYYWLNHLGRLHRRFGYALRHAYDMRRWRNWFARQFGRA